MIVVDANVIVPLVLKTVDSARAERALRADSDWAAPLLWRSELRSVLALYLRKKLLTFDRAYAAQRQAEELIGGREYMMDSLEVLSLASSSNCSAYDCEYVALAQQLRVPLLTLDKQLLRAFPTTAVSLRAAGH